MFAIFCCPALEFCGRSVVSLVSLVFSWVASFSNVVVDARRGVPCGPGDCSEVRGKFLVHTSVLLTSIDACGMSFINSCCAPGVMASSLTEFSSGVTVVSSILTVASVWSVEILVSSWVGCDLGASSIRDVEAVGAPAAFLIASCFLALSRSIVFFLRNILIV